MTDTNNNKWCWLRFLRDLFLLFGKIIFTVISASFSAIFPKAKKPLKGEIVLVTGAGKGLGRELALKFASLQAILVLWDIDEKSACGVAEEIRNHGGQAYAYECDVSSWESVARVGQKVQQDVGDVTVLVNNAGIMQNRSFLDLDIDKIRKTMEINILSNFWTDKYFLPSMVAKNKGHIVAISSMAGLIGWLYMVDYGASKFAIVGMMEALEEELRYLGKDKTIICTTICPLTIDTGLNQNPTTRSQKIIPILDTKLAASIIVEAVQRNERIITLPRKFKYPVFFRRMFPRKVTQLVLDFFEYNLLPNNPPS